MSDPKARIITHMNKRHQLSLIDYLVAYGKIKLSNIKEKSVKMTNVNEKGINLQFYDLSKKKTENMIILWDKAPEDDYVQVNAMSDIKSKLVAMAKYSAKVQGFAHVKVEKVAAPQPWAYFIYLALVLLAVESYYPGFLRGIIANDNVFSMLIEYLPSSVSAIGTLVEKYANMILVTCLSIHILETLFILLPKMHKYRVPTNQRLIWIIMVFLGGFAGIMRFNKLIEH